MVQLEQRNLWGIVLAAGEGSRVRDFLKQLCGGRGIKQFCAVIGRRSLLEHTLARVERIIPRERILIVVSADHREEIIAQLSSWPAGNVIFQPLNRDTAPGVLLPLAHLTCRKPSATVAIFPSDHFILEETRFMTFVRDAVSEVQRFPQNPVFLGMTPTGPDESYGWIEPAEKELGRETRAVREFWEKPAPRETYALLKRGALWNTFVCIAQANTLWEMARLATPALYDDFRAIRQMLHFPRANRGIENKYRGMQPANFSTDICEPLARSLRVLPVPDVGWSDWGSVKRICLTLEQLGKLDLCLARLDNRQKDIVGYSLETNREPSRERYPEERKESIAMAVRGITKGRGCI